MHQPAPRLFPGVFTPGAALAASAFLFGAAASAAPVAVFSGDGLEVVIDDAGSDGRALSGTLLHLGERYPFTATTQSDFARSEGEFHVGSDIFLFSLLPTGKPDTLQLVTGDALRNNEVVYDLRLQKAALAASTPARHDEPPAGRAASDAGAPATVSSPTSSGPAPAAPAPAVPAVSGPVGLTLRGLKDVGWEVTAVDPGSRAERAGFASGDVITTARDAGGADLPLPDRSAVIAALTTPGTFLTTARAGRADHTVVLYPGEPTAAAATSSQRATGHASEPHTPAQADPVVETQTDRATHAPTHDTKPAAADAVSAPVPPAEPAPVFTAALTLAPATVTDTAGTGLASHTLLVPEGWTLDAKVLWTPAVDAAFVNLSARTTSPGGALQVTWLPDGAFTDAAGAGTAIGAIYEGKVHFPRFGSAADFVQTSVLPGFRSAATNVQVLSGDVSPGVADAWERHHETFLTAQKQRIAALHSTRGGSATTATVTAPRVRLRYEENGVAYDEQFTSIHLVLTTPVGTGVAHDWYIFAVNALRAPAGQLDAATPGLRSLAESLRPTQRWQAAIEALTPELTRAEPPLTAAEVTRHAGSLVDELDALVTAHVRGWSGLREARAARLEAFAQAHAGLRVATTADGTARGLLPEGDGLRALVNPHGAVVLTQDAPATDAARPEGPWAELK